MNERRDKLDAAAADLIPGTRHDHLTDGALAATLLARMGVDVDKHVAANGQKIRDRGSVYLVEYALQTYEQRRLDALEDAEWHRENEARHTKRRAAAARLREAALKLSREPLPNSRFK